MAERFDPYYEWLSIPPKDQPPHHYRLLGVEIFESDVKLIESAAQQRVTHLRTHQMGKHADLSQKLLNEVASARATLLSPEGRADYNAVLRGSLMAVQAATPPVRGPASAAGAPGWMIPLVLAGTGIGLVGLIAVIFFATRSPSGPPVAQQPKPPVQGAADKPAPPTPPILPPKKPAIETPAKTKPADPNPEVSPFVPIPSPPSPQPPQPANPPPTPPVAPMPAPMPAPVPPPMPAPVTPPPAVRPDVPPPDARIVRSRAEVPDDKARVEADTTIRTVLKSDLAAARTADQKRDLARKVLKIAQEEKAGTATHYAGLQLAREVAAASQDMDAIQTAISALSVDYEVDDTKLRAETFTAALDAPGPAAAKKPLVAAALGSIEELFEKDRFASADATLAAVAETARTLKDTELIRTAAELKKTGTEMAAQFRTAEPAFTTLKTAPSDPASNGIAGRYLAFIKGDFEGGLAMLAQSNDLALTALAKADIAQPKEAKEQLALADKWYDFAALAGTAEKPLVRERAALWYRAAAEMLTGLEKAKATKRIAELPTPRARSGGVASSNPYLVTVPPLGLRVKVLSASYGAGGTRKDVTEMVRKHLLKDPFAPVGADDRSMGDPTPGQNKTIQVRYEVDGKAVTVEERQPGFARVPLLPDEGQPLPGASQAFRIVAARYGAGLTWSDVTLLVRQRVTHPGQSIKWNAMTWDDPWFGVPKYFLVWFDYLGRRYSFACTENDVKPLFAGGPTPPPSRNFGGVLQHEAWTHERPAGKLASNQKAFGYITQMAGRFLGGGEEVRLVIGDDGHWTPIGRTAQPLALHAETVTTPLRDKFETKVEEFTWSPGSKPVKMIPATEGFCILTTAMGHFGGGGEMVWVTIDPKDGCWYLDGAAANGDVGGRAMAFRLKPGAKAKLRYVEYILSGYSATMMEKNQGFAYLSGIRGNFAGFGEQAKVLINDKGQWELIGQNCAARAIAVFVEE